MLSVFLSCRHKTAVESISTSSWPHPPLHIQTCNMDRSEMREPEAAATKVEAYKDIDLVVSPTSADANVVARFEFATNANKATKVLLVEWECDTDEPPAERCDVTWDGRKEAIRAVDNDNSSMRRLVFFLSHSAAVPPTISIHRPGRSTLQAKPLPAIFAPGLGGSKAAESGRCGVLHTLWARLRLAVLDREIEREAGENTESVGLDMAVKEKEDIIKLFGLEDKRKNVESVKPILPPLSTAISPTPIHPNNQSPMSIRMTEKLKGLKLATSPEGLAAAASGM